MTQFNHFSIGAFVHVMLLGLFAWTLWRIPRKTKATKFLLAYSVLGMVNFVFGFFYASLNVPWQGNLGHMQYAWLLAAQWLFLEFAYELVSEFSAIVNKTERRIMRWLCGSITFISALFSVAQMFVAIEENTLVMTILSRWISLSLVSILLMNCWTIVVFVRCGRAARSRGGSSEEVVPSVASKALFALALLTLVTLCAYSLQVLRGALVISFLSSVMVGNVLTTIYIAGLFLVYTHVSTEQISTASKLKFSVLATLFLFLSPVCMIVLSDRQHEFEEQQLRHLEVIDDELALMLRAHTPEEGLAFAQHCRAASFRGLFVQSLDSHQSLSVAELSPLSLAKLHPVEYYLKPGHPELSANKLLYLASEADSGRYQKKLIGRMMEKSTGTGRSIRGADYLTAFLPAPPNDSIRYDTHAYIWLHGSLLCHAMLPYAPLAKYIERPFWAMIVMLLATVILVPLSIDALLRQTFEKPFQHLLAGVDEANRGNLDVRLPVIFNDELGRLTANFNQMIASIQTAQASYYAALEQTHRERERISQDVHDDVGSTLTRIALLSEALRFYQANPQQFAESSTEQTQQRLAAIAQTARDAVTSLSEIIWAIKPVNDSLENFFAYTREYALELFDESQTRCEVSVVQFPETLLDIQLLPETRRNAFLVVKESLNNVLKHANATSVRLEYELECGREHEYTLIMHITDDGQGFDEHAKRLKNNGGNGLANMRRRTETLGGTFSIESGATITGTRVTARIPLREG